MKPKPSRRTFLGGTAAIALGAAMGPATVASPAPPGSRLGVFLPAGANPETALERAAALGLQRCELEIDRFDAPFERLIREARARLGLTIDALFTMGPGPLSWDFTDGPTTNGLVPREWRRARVERLCQASDLAYRLGIGMIETHAGFLPENPRDPLYAETIAALQEVVDRCAGNGQTFLYHAGQETPVTLLRTIQDVGRTNQGIGLDTANGILYGTGHPCDALEVYAPHVRIVQAKDGLWPTDPHALGREVPLGEGRVDVPRLMRALRLVRFEGPILIEREISGAEQLADIRRAIILLQAELDAAQQGG